MSEPEPIPLSDWDAVTAGLRAFGDRGDVSAGEGWIRVDFGSAHVECSRDGHISTGMPLHEFEREGDAEIVIDHDRGTLAVDADDVSYTFRRPGG